MSSSVVAQGGSPGQPARSHQAVFSRAHSCPQSLQAVLPENEDIISLVLSPDDLPAIARLNPLVAASAFSSITRHAPPALRHSFVEQVSRLPLTIPTLEFLSGLAQESVLVPILGDWLATTMEGIDALDAGIKAGTGSGDEEELARAVKLVRSVSSVSLIVSLTPWPLQLCLFLSRLETGALDESLHAEMLSFTLRFSRFSAAHELFMRLSLP